MQRHGPVDGANAAALPDVSVIVPLRDMPLPLVQRALLSAVEQDYPGVVEVVIWNDGSAHRSYRPGLDMLVRALRTHPGRREVHVHHSLRNRGISAARNAACRAATGEWYIWLDGDDELAPHAISHLVAATRASRDVRLVVGQCEAVLPEGSQVHRNDGFVQRWRSTKGLPDDPLLAAVFAVHGALVHRRAFARVGGFNEGISHGELTDWFLRVMALLPSAAVTVTGRTTYRYHKRPGSHSAQWTRIETNRVRALRRYAETVPSTPPHEIRFGRRCRETGARLYDLLTTTGHPVVADDVEIATQPWSFSRGAGAPEPANGGVPHRDTGAALVAEA